MQIDLTVGSALSVLHLATGYGLISYYATAITLIALNKASAAPIGRGFVRQEMAQASARTPPKNIP